MKSRFIVCTESLYLGVRVLDSYISIAQVALFSSYRQGLPQVSSSSVGDKGPQYLPFLTYSPDVAMA